MKQSPRKKLVGNGLWETSRMMLPQHIEQFNRYTAESNKINRPIIADEEKSYILGLIRSAQACCLPVTLTLYTEYELQQITALVEAIEVRRGVKLLLDESGDDWRWIPFDDIVAAEFDQYN